MAEYRFNFAKCDQSLDSIEQIHGRITTALDELEGNVERSLQGWQSEAAKTAYYTAKVAWENSAQNMTSVLNTARAKLEEVKLTYQAADKQNEAGWTALPG